MDLTYRIERMAEILDRTDITYSYASALLHTLFSEWEVFLEKKGNVLEYVYEALDYRFKELTVDEYIVLRHVAHEVAKERGW